MGSDFTNFPDGCHGSVPLEARNCSSFHDLPRHHIACSQPIYGAGSTDGHWVMKGKSGCHSTQHEPTRPNDGDVLRGRAFGPLYPSITPSRPASSLLRPC